MLTLKVLACLALSMLMLLPVVLRGSLQEQVVQTPAIAHVDVHSLWSSWPER